MYKYQRLIRALFGKPRDVFVTTQSLLADNFSGFRSIVVFQILHHLGNNLLPVMFPLFAVREGVVQIFVA